MCTNNEGNFLPKYNITQVAESLHCRKSNIMPISGYQVEVYNSSLTANIVLQIHVFSTINSDNLHPIVVPDLPQLLDRVDCQLECVIGYR